MRAAGRSWRRRWLVPEIVQGSAMDCGPAALQCLLAGAGVPVSYSRLREACQTDIDGTSIDALETVANDLGLRAEQILVPVEHVLADPRQHLPALAVVRLPDGAAHFVVVWRRVGPWLQIMDPASGRDWVRADRFAADLVRHEASVPAETWRAWAVSPEALESVRRRLSLVGVGRPVADRLVASASADETWFGHGALDAVLRLVATVVASGGVPAGRQAAQLIERLVATVRADPADIHALVPPDAWSVGPDLENRDASQERLLVRGGVFLRVTGVEAAGDRRAAGAVPHHLRQALAEPSPSPARAVWAQLRADGAFAPVALTLAAAVAAVTTVVEALLYRGLFDISATLVLGAQRVVAAVALLTFMGLAVALHLPLVREALRLGRTLEVRMRMALLTAVPRLGDRYFQSRPVSDLADRGHSLHQLRLLPGIALHLVQTALELVLTVAGIAWADPSSAPVAGALALASVGVPLAGQALLGERDLRVRSHAAALGRVHLDAMRGLVPLRAHRAQAALRHQHQTLLAEWARSSRRLLRAALTLSAAQAVCGTGLTALVLVLHFARARGVTGLDLLLVYWTIKLPATGETLAGLLRQYPAQRNVLLRLFEPLAAPRAMTDVATVPRARVAGTPRGVRVDLVEARVVVAGRTILDGLNLRIDPGEHVAVVGPSGAGKSTLLGILLGWHHVAAGQACVDGVALGPATHADLRQVTAWLDPAVHLWNRSLLDNLRYAAPDDDVLAAASAADAAGLRGVLQHLPDGLQTPLGEGGCRLSGGEGQRVRVGRALVQRGIRLALLDEPCRGLDRLQRQAQLTSMRRHWRDATLVCVTHDLAETRGFDRVLVMEHGRLVEDGPPSLLAAGPTRYRALLDAEARVRVRSWQDGHWRHLRVEGGRATECPAERLESVT